MSTSIKLFWCWTYKFLSNFLYRPNWHELYYCFFVYLYQPIHWYLTRILMFLSEQRAPFSTMFAWELSITWYDHSAHSNVQVSIFVTCLNFAGTGCDCDRALYVAIVLTWHLAFKTSDRTTRAMRPVISGNTHVAYQYLYSKRYVSKFYKQSLEWAKLTTIYSNAQPIETHRKPAGIIP